jgi:hypothetical protein
VPDYIKTCNIGIIKHVIRQSNVYCGACALSAGFMATC